MIAESDPGNTIVLDATSVYWTSFNTVRKAPLGGGPAITLAVDPAGYTIFDLTVDATSVYWPSTTAIMKLPIEGGTPIDELPTGKPAYLGGPSVKVNQTNVFWVSRTAPSRRCRWRWIEEDGPRHSATRCVHHRRRAERLLDVLRRDHQEQDHLKKDGWR